ncbi:MAG: isocitrate/isopropylmalate dehydrogenase family protein [Actinomycetota bacterium]|nr:isocitrate/isopropylmalate dehydrogenase family protein [Actinomycetota bacterium]
MTTVTLIPGDGIGPEVAAATRRAVDELACGIEWDVHEAGVLAIETHGNPLPLHVLESIKENRVAVKGPVTTPVGTGFRSINVALRQELDLFASVRPCRLYEGVPSPHDQVDIIVVRENTEDLYEGIEFEMGSPEVEKLRGFLKYMHGFVIRRDAGVSIKPISITATRDIVNFAFELARKHGRKKVTLGHKANIMRFSDGVWLETGEKSSADYPDVSFDEMQVDEMAMALAWIPKDLDVLVLPNLYGDIISDLCAGLVGGLGVAPGMNLGKRYAVFEPTHGSAPDIAGQGIANPLAMMLSTTLMLRHLDLFDDADRLERAVATVLRERRVVPGDLRPEGEPATTDAITAAVVAAIQAGS